MPANQPKQSPYYQVKKAFRVFKAFLRRESFYCKALAGESSYNICINSDLTVSCNCQDYNGQGHIGDLKEHSLEQIFHNSTANNFRSMLSRRKFPTDQCLTCQELARIPGEQANHYLEHFRVPRKGIMVENTALCNLKCPMCKREQLLGVRGKTTLSIKDVEKIAATLKENRIESVYYFNLGEPFLPADIDAQVMTIRAANPDIRIIVSTNGLLLDTDEKLAAAMQMDYIFISLDGVDQKMVSRYQVGNSFAKVYANMARLTAMKNQTGRIKNGVRLPIIEWRYILFRWNDKPAHLHKAVELARNAGVDLLVFAPGAARFTDRSYRYRFRPYFASIGTKRASGEILVNLSGVPKHLVSP